MENSNCPICGGSKLFEQDIYREWDSCKIVEHVVCEDCGCLAPKEKWNHSDENLCEHCHHPLNGDGQCHHILCVGGED